MCEQPGCVLDRDHPRPWHRDLIGNEFAAMPMCPARSDVGDLRCRMARGHFGMHAMGSGGWATKGPNLTAEDAR